MRRESVLLFAVLLVAVLVGCASSDAPAGGPSLGAAFTSAAVTTTSSAVTGDTGVDVSDRAARRSDHTDDVSDDTAGDDDPGDVEDAADSGVGGGVPDISHLFEDDREGDGDDFVSDDTPVAAEVDGDDVVEVSDDTDDDIDEADEAGDGVMSVVGGGDVVGVLGDTAGGVDSNVGDAREGVGEVVDEDLGDVGVEVDAPVVRYVDDGVGGVLVEGPCGWLGPVCPLAADTAPIDAGGPLRYHEPWEDWSTWVGRVLDLCDDHEALIAVNKEWYIGSRDRIDYGARIPDEGMVYVEEERQRHPVVCSQDEASTPFWKCWGDGSGESIAKLRDYLSGFAEPPAPSEVQAWAESVGLDCWDAAAEQVRYVYMTANGPMLPQSSVEAAVEGYLKRVAQAEDQQGTAAVGQRLGAYPASYVYGYKVETPVDALFVVTDEVSVSVIDGVVRGMAQNHSERLWARNVIVTATDPTGVVGEWQWPLTVQPLEIFPFEIENWTGTQNPTEMDFTITAALSPTIDLTRSLELHWYSYYDNKATYLYWHDYPEEMGAFPYGTTAFEAMEDDDNMAWTEFDIRRQGSTTHPQLAEAAEQQTIRNLTVYAATTTDDTVDGAWIVEEVWEMTPMDTTRGPGEWDGWDSEDWIESRTISTVSDWDPSIDESATVAFVGVGRPRIWAGGANPNPRTPDAGTQ